MKYVLHIFAYFLHIICKKSAKKICKKYAKKYLGMVLLWPKDSSNPIRDAAAIFSCCSSIFAAFRIPLACSFESKLHLDLKCNQAADENPEYKAILAMRD